jgi:hypothetical protein
LKIPNEVIRNRKSKKNRPCNSQTKRKRTKRQTTIYTEKKLKIKQQENRKWNQVFRKGRKFLWLTLLFEQWIIFKNLQFILLFLNIWTLTFYCFRLKNVFIYIFWDFRVSNHCWAFCRLLWLSKLPSNHSVKQLINIYKTQDKYFRSGIIYIQNWRVCELLKCFLIQKQLTNRPQVITNHRPQVNIRDNWKTLKYLNINEIRKHECRKNVVV